MTLYKLLKKALTGFFKTIFALEVHGEENVPSDGRYVLVSNHISNADVIMLAVTCKRPICFMAKKELFMIPLFAQLIRALGAFPVDRKGSALSALKAAVKRLKDGETVGLFPQGTRQRDKSVYDTEFKTGAAFCAYRAQAGYIPAYIKTKDQRFGLFKKTEIFYGMPTEYESLPFSEGGSTEYDEVTELIKRSIGRLEEEAYGKKYDG